MTHYPRATETLRRMLAARDVDDAPLGSFQVGPGVLRAPPRVMVPTTTAAPTHDVAAGTSDDGRADTDEMLGELVDMMLVGADEADSGDPEVHLVFKADVLGGLHLKLIRRVDGLVATFVVRDAAARREVAGILDDLLRHLADKGFRIVQHSVEIRG